MKYAVSRKKTQRKRTCLDSICMVSDFFYPNMGGVEEHIYNLSQCLLELGHKVIVITHTYGERKGVRWMANGLKVYYVPAQIFYNGAILPNMVTLLPILREILLRESVTIVHGHGAFSSLAHDALFAAKLLDIKTVFTDHSLFGFADASAVITNRFLELSLADVNHCICVSRIGKANTVLRAKIEGDGVSVIPNAVDAAVFRPLEPGEVGPPKDRIQVVILCRLVYRKGVDLLTGIIPEICARHKNVDFLIGGDGPKRLELEEIREQYGSRVEIFGKVDHALVRDFLIKGHIFLNTSLTEAFCMAIVEAAASGLQVVSTRVGGIPEVLPPELIMLADATVPSLVGALNKAIRIRKQRKFHDPFKGHRIVASMYNWRDIARRTEIVYSKVNVCSNPTDRERMEGYMKFGRITGPLFCLVLSLGRIIMWLCDIFRPFESIDIASSFPGSKKMKQMTL